MSGYWISPNGQLFAVAGTHEGYLIENPDLFGFENIEDISLNAAVGKRWIRVRIIGNIVTIHLHKFDTAARKNITGFVKAHSDLSPEAKIHIFAQGEHGRTYHVTTREMMDNNME